MTDTYQPVLFKRLHPDAKIPERKTSMSAGFDLCAIDKVQIIGGRGNYLVKTGIAVRLPHGTYGRIAIRSGLAVNHHLTVSAGVIDRDYSGEIGIVVSCTNNSIGYVIEQGERFAQLIIERCDYGDGVLVDELPSIGSAHDGYGSTGKF